MNSFRKLGFLMVFSVVTLFGPQAVLADEAAKGKVIVTGAFGPTSSDRLVFPIGDVPGHAIIQQMRTDTLQSQDARWNGLTAKIYEQLDAYPTQGTFSIYAEFSDPGRESRGKGYAFFAGSFAVNIDGSARFSAKGDLLGGSGDFAGLAGHVFVDGTITAAAGGRYTLKLILTK